MSVGAAAAKVLEATTKQLKKLPDEEIDALLAGQGELRYIPADLLPAVRMLLGLSDEQRKQLVAKEASVKFVPPNYRVAPVAAPRPTVQKAAAPKPAPPSADEVRQRLSTVASEAEARDYLTSLPLNATAQKTLAKQLGVPLATKASANDAIEGIIKVVVRSRLSAEAIRSY